MPEAVATWSSPNVDMTLIGAWPSWASGSSRSMSSTWAPTADTGNPPPTGLAETGEVGGDAEVGMAAACATGNVITSSKIKTISSAVATSRSRCRYSAVASSMPAAAMTGSMGRAIAVP